MIRAWLVSLVVVLNAVEPVSSAAEVAFEGGVTMVYQGADDSRVDGEFSASGDLFVTRSTEAGEWHLYLEASTTPDANGVSALYPTANADAGSVIDRDGGGGVQISELNYTFRLSGQRALMLGLIDPSAWLDRGRIANDENQHFINGSFVNNTTIEFPDYTLGGVFRWPGAARRPELVLVVASSDGKADLPDRSYQELLNLTADERGAFIGAGASWLRERTSVRAGLWVRTDDHAVAGRPDASEMNYGAYGVLGWQSGGHALNARLGLSNDRVSVATRFIGLAYEREMRFGRLGAGVAKTLISKRFRRADLADTLDAEIFYRIPVLAGKAHLTPSLQFVENPGFDASGKAADSRAFVASIRFRWDY